MGCAYCFRVRTEDERDPSIAFVDAGTAWDSPRNRWDVAHQHFATDGGLGLATSEDVAGLDRIAEEVRELVKGFPAPGL